MTDKMLMTKYAQDYLIENIDYSTPSRKVSLQCLRIPSITPRRQPPVQNKELNYYVQQKLRPQVIEKTQHSMELLRRFKNQIGNLSESEYIQKKLEKQFMNLQYSDEQKETYGQKISQLARKHKQQLDYVLRIEQSVKNKYRRMAEDVDVANTNIPQTSEPSLGSTEVLVQIQKILGSNSDVFNQMIQLIFLLRLTLAHFQLPVRTHLAYDYPLVDKQQVEYTIDMQFGSQNKTFQLVIDTGSSDLWVPEVGARGFNKRLPKFDCSQSKTCIKTNQEYSIYYDDGPILGHLAWDDVRIGSLLFNQSFLLIQRGSGNMVSCDGILGLGFKGIQTNPNKSILKSMFDQGLIDSEMFSLYLVDKGAHGSEIIFGGVDTQFMRKGDQIITIPLVDKSRYMVDLKGISVGGQLQRIELALVDSGTSCLTMPGATIDAIVTIFEKQNIHCSLVVEQYAPAYSMVICVLQTINPDEILAQFPNVDIVFNDNTLTLQARDYLYGCKQISANQSRCSTKLERSTQDDFLLLGDAFLQSYYTIFDQTKRTIGFVHSINQGSFVYHGWQSAVHSLTLIVYSVLVFIS